jgi:hypothetical protein
MELSTEIRIEIFRQLFEHSKTYFSGGMSHWPYLLPMQGNLLSIAKINQQLRDGAEVALFEKAAFRVEIGETGVNFLYKP